MNNNHQTENITLEPPNILETDGINNKYKPHVRQFIVEGERTAHRDIEVADESNSSLLRMNGSPPLVGPDEKYYLITTSFTDKCVNGNKRSENRIRSQEGVSGKNGELVFDQITVVETHQDSNCRNTIVIWTSWEESIQVNSTLSETVGDRGAEIRQKVRDNK